MQSFKNYASDAKRGARVLIMFKIFWLKMKTEGTNDNLNWFDYFGPHRLSHIAQSVV